MAAHPDRGSSDARGNQIAWSTSGVPNRDLACSGLRFAYDGLSSHPTACAREQHRIAPDAQDWVNVLTDFSVRHLPFARIRATRTR